ncbi:MAG: serine hydrolase domain-containing protein, partial [Bradymonadia bacterium]
MWKTIPVFILSLMSLYGCTGASETKPEPGDSGIDMGRIDGDAGTDAGMQTLDAGRDAAVPDLDAESPLPDQGQESPFAVEIARQITAPLISERGASGLTVIIVSNDGTHVIGVGERSYGGDAVDAQTVFQIGSVTKPITGFLLAAMLSSENPAITLDSELNSHLTGLTIPDYDGQQVTFRHAVSHYGSLVNLPSNLTGPVDSPGRGYSREALSAFLEETQLNGPPGEQYAYSNLGYGLLGIGLGDLTGGSYEQVLNTLFIEPLGLSRTGLNTELFVETAGGNHARGHLRNGGAEVGFAHMGVLDGAGEVLMSGEDMAAFLRIMVRVDPYPVAGAVDRVLTSLGAGEGMMDIGYGWNIQPVLGIWGKSGITPGFTASVVLKPEQQLAVAILSNRGAFMGVQR